MNRTTPVTMATTPAPRDVLLLFLPKDSPEAWLDTMARNHPNVEVRWGNPRDYRAPEDLPAEMWDGVTVYCSFRPPPARLMKTVRFVQLTSAGADLWVNHPIYQKPEVEFCTSNGIHPYVMPSQLNYSFVPPYSDDICAGPRLQNGSSVHIWHTPTSCSSMQTP